MLLTLDTVIPKFVCISDLPYSQKSRDVFPLWEELAEAFKKREEVIVARVDASANDINMSMQGTYPSLCLFPALYAERVGSISALMSFLDVWCEINGQFPVQISLKQIDSATSRSFFLLLILILLF